MMTSSVGTATGAASTLEGVRPPSRYGQIVTVVNISGEIDVSNVESVIAYVLSSVSQGDALLVDMTGVSFFAGRGLSLLITIESTYCRTGSPWALVASPAVERLLRHSAHAHAFPVTRSARGAMQYFAYHAYVTARPRRTRKRSCSPRPQR